ncbi:hypothetical protein FACS189440_13950 [Bacteroidia bacterium]|nr:hypothetical protein FACS189440_13950 [Bacteroidia bacterium]
MNSINPTFCLIVTFCITSFSISAQEKNLFKDMLKESIKEAIKMDMKIDYMMEKKMASDSVSGPIELDVNKEPLPHLGYNQKQNSLYLHHKDSLPLEKQWTISPNLTAAYTNPKGEEYDPASPEAIQEMMNNRDFYRPVNQRFMVNPLTIVGLVLLKLTGQAGQTDQSGVKPSGLSINDLFIRKKSAKSEKALKYITEEIYPAEEK